jgi:hypothetical protein
LVFILAGNHAAAGRTPSSSGQRASAFHYNRGVAHSE